MFNNGIILQFSVGTAAVGNKTITFPLAFTQTPSVIGVGFTIEAIGQQYVSVTLTTLRLSSNVHNCTSNGWLCLGI